MNTQWIIRHPPSLFTFQDMLNSEYEARNAKNHRYSQRAFARDLGLTSARTSELLSKKQGLSKKSALAICDRLNWQGLRRELFVTVVLARHARGRMDRQLADRHLAYLLQSPQL